MGSNCVGVHFDEVTILILTNECLAWHPRNSENSLSPLLKLGGAQPVCNELNSHGGTHRRPWGPTSREVKVSSHLCQTRPQLSWWHQSASTWYHFDNKQSSQRASFRNQEQVLAICVTRVRSWKSTNCSWQAVAQGSECKGSEVQSRKEEQLAALYVILTCRSQRLSSRWQASANQSTPEPPVKSAMQAG